MPERVRAVFYRFAFGAGLLSARAFPIAGAREKMAGGICASFLRAKVKAASQIQPRPKSKALCCVLWLKIAGSGGVLENSPWFCKIRLFDGERGPKSLD